MLTNPNPITNLNTNYNHRYMVRYMKNSGPQGKTVFTDCVILHK